MKKCKICLIEYEIYFFGRHKGSKDGYLGACKKCVKEYNKKYHINTYKKHPRVLKKDIDKLIRGKACSNCEILKPLTEFSPIPKGATSSQCKKCLHEKRRRYYYRTHSVRKIKAKTYRDNTKEFRKSLWDRYYEKNKENIIRKACITSYERRKKIKGLTPKTGTDITPDFLIELLNKTTHCEICLVSLQGTKVHLDHILPICKGGTNMRNNVRYICAACNLRRPKDGNDLIGTPHEHLLLTNPLGLTF